MRSVGKERNSCTFLGLKPEGESEFGRSKPRWEVYIEKFGRVWTGFFWLVIRTWSFHSNSGILHRCHNDHFSDIFPAHFRELYYSSRLRGFDLITAS